MNRRRPGLFFVLAFAFSWIIWLPLVLDGILNFLPFDISSFTLVFVIIGAFGPALAACVLIFRQERWQGVKTFLRNGIDFRFAPIYLVLALGLPLIIHAVAHYLALALGFDVAATLLPDEGAPPVVLAIPYFFIMFLFGGGQEEYGWRGYAQSPLQESLGFIRASLLIGVVWGIWHLPLWFMPGDSHSSYSFLAFLIFTTSISVVYTWL